MKRTTGNSRRPRRNGQRYREGQNAAQKSIYGLDDIAALRSDPRWRGRVFTINKDQDNLVQLEAALDEFIAGVTFPYYGSLHSLAA
jgi:hypothetical protein